ncbi:MAG: galactokinase [Chloroflexi bacterium]|nr:galactokinase [Chloroflexota bacterium]
MSRLREVTLQAYYERYGHAAEWIAFAPGRVNLIGEHTDYNDGFVLPMAIERGIWIAFSRSETAQVAMHFADFDRSESFPIDKIVRGEHSPAEYVKGMARMLSRDGIVVHGWQGVIQGDIPVGAGLSSSAALEMAAGAAFCALADMPWHPIEMARRGQAVENDWLGLQTGIMDQTISAAGQAGSALLIDCRSLEVSPAPLPTDSLVVVLDTSTRRGLVHSAYNERRQQCEAGAKHFGVKALRDVSVNTFTARAGELDDLTRRRCRHVITENQRTLDAFEAMRASDAPRLGALMYESHVSLRDDFEVSTEYLNAIVETARGHDACFGARMTGAGFGGCGVALVSAEGADDFVTHVEREYHAQTGKTPALYISSASRGAFYERA